MRIDDDLRRRAAQQASIGNYWAGKCVALLGELDRLRTAYGIEGHEIEQLVASLYPDEFPTYPDDWPGAAGERCVGDHTPVTLVSKLAAEARERRTDEV